MSQEELKAAIDRWLNAKASAGDIAKIRNALGSGKITIAESGSVAIGGNVSHSLIITGTNIQFMLTSKAVRLLMGQSMEPTRVEALIQQYKETVCEAWDSIKTEDVKIPLRDVFVMLETVASTGSRNEKRPDLVPTDERLEHSGHNQKGHDWEDPDRDSRSPPVVAT